MIDNSKRRWCCVCGGGPIEACMGFVLGRDYIAMLDGDRTRFPREMCGVCVLISPETIDMRNLAGRYRLRLLQNLGLALPRAEMVAS